MPAKCNFREASFAWQKKFIYLDVKYLGCKIHVAFTRVDSSIYICHKNQCLLQIPGTLVNFIRLSGQQIWEQSIKCYKTYPPKYCYSLQFEYTPRSFALIFLSKWHFPNFRLFLHCTTHDSPLKRIPKSGCATIYWVKLKKILITIFLLDSIIWWAARSERCNLYLYFCNRLVGALLEKVENTVKLLIY